MNKKNKNYLAGAAIIAAGGILSKFLGIFFKIPISNLIGSYGLGLYSYAYPLYLAFLAISTIGLPVAVSKMVSEMVSLNDYDGAKKVFRIAFITLTSIGALASAVMFFGAELFIKLFSWDPNAYYCIVSLAIAPFFVSMISAYRGYFQGLQMMSISAISQILEQIGRVAIGVGLAYYLTNRFGVIYGAAGAVFGAVAGAIISFLFLFIAKTIYSVKNPPLLGQASTSYTSSAILKRILIIAIPITMAGLVTTIMDLINSATVSSCLKGIGYLQEEATSLLGILEQRAQTLVNVPIVLGTALSTSLVPSISSSYALKNSIMARKKASLAIRMAFIVSLPCAIGLCVLSDPIIEMLFGSTEGGAMLSILAFSAITTIAMTTLQGILQGANRFYSPLFNMCIGAAVKCALNILLLSNPDYNIFGAIYSTLAATLVIFILNYIQVNKYIGFENVWLSIFKAFVSAIIMGVLTNTIFTKLSLNFGIYTSVIISIGIAVVVYLGLIIASKAFTLEDYERVRE